jgi:hypothetical protein
MLRTHESPNIYNFIESLNLEQTNPEQELFIHFDQSNEKNEKNKDETENLMSPCE